MVRHWELARHLPGPIHQRSIATVLALPVETVTSCFDAVRPRPPAPLGVRALGLRSLRREHDTSVRTLAHMLTVREATIYNWESGRARLPLHQIGPLASFWDFDEQQLRLALTAPERAQYPAAPRTRASELRRMRRMAGLSRTEVATFLGLSAHAIARWENGAVPPLYRVRALAELYGRPVAAVAAAAGQAPPPALHPRCWSPGSLPAVLRALRAYSGLTQRDVARRCACSIDAVRDWEHGRKIPRADRRRQLEEAFGLSPEALLPAWPRRSRARQ